MVQSPQFEVVFLSCWVVNPLGIVMCRKQEMCDLAYFWSLQLFQTRSSQLFVQRYLLN